MDESINWVVLPLLVIDRLPPPPPPERAARGSRVLLYSRKLLIDVFLGLNGSAISSKMVLKLQDLHRDLRTVPTVPSLINT